jgi:hypothetical protein
MDTRLAVEEFFRTFEYNTNHGDTAALVAPFAAIFLAAGPQGATCVRKEDFALALPRRKQLFDNLGCGATELVRIQTETLDPRYSKARTQWKMTFTSGDSRAREIFVESTYMVDTGKDPFEIVVYLAHQDIMAVLKEQGIMKD